MYWNKDSFFFIIIINICFVKFFLFRSVIFITRDHEQHKKWDSMNFKLLKIWVEESNLEKGICIGKWRKTRNKQVAVRWENLADRKPSLKKLAL